MRRLVILTTVALLVGCTGIGAIDSCVPVATRPSVSTQDLVESCVLVGTTRGHGSGFVVGEQLVVTAAHVAVNAVVIRLQDGTVLPILAVVPHTSEDAAILIVAGRLPASLPVSYERVDRGDKVVTVGAPYSKGLQGNMLFGRVANVNIRCAHDPTDPNIIDINDLLGLNVGPGISGAPVLKTATSWGLQLA